MSGSRIRTLIVDDEPLARQTLRILLEADAEIELAGECSNGVDAVEAIHTLAPDLVFLDIQMPEMDGFDVLGALDSTKAPVVVFVTAFDRYALKAFEVHALDYLLKPFTDERFAAALAQAKTEVAQRDVRALSERLLAMLADRDRERPGRYLTRVLVKSASRVTFQKVAEIDWIGAAGSYVQMHVGAKEHLLRESLAALEAKLDPELFLRIHRSTIVNMDRVKELRPDAYGEYVVVLENGTELKMSRGRREHVQSRLVK
ncbi:MAG TPA: response regulator [Blastocatellia bacterium]|nr:response regulator [Blastocatellia bacterium]